jgi:hypothetical protein
LAPQLSRHDEAIISSALARAMQKELARQRRRLAAMQDALRRSWAGFARRDAARDH